MDALSFFTTSKNVWVSENFQRIFLDTYEHTKNIQKLYLKSSDLRDIQPKTNTEDILFQDADIFLEQLALLIEEQIDGRDGQLLNDSSANYFFLKGKDGKYYSILVRWEPAQKLWRCGAYLQENLQMPNVRIFYPL